MNRSKKKMGWKSFGGILAFLAFFGGKLKFLLPLLKLGKFGGTIWSMALMVGAYALIYPWSFAIGVVVMIFIHEMGHVIAAKRKGIPVSAPAFIPFLGALITMKKQPVDAATEAYLAFGGPLIGTLGALAAFFLGVGLESPVLLSIAQIGFFLNLINLIPIHPLDGGRIVTAISRWLWVIGLIGGLIVIIYLKALIFLIFWAMFAWELYKKYVRKNRGEPEELQRGRTKVTISVDKAHFMESGLPIPAEAHERDLGLVQLCKVESKEEVCYLYYPGIGTIAELPFPQGLVEHARLHGTVEESDEVKMTILLTFIVYPELQTGLIQSEEYYEVPAKVRWGYGIAYFGLALFLGWMMLQTYSAILPPPIIG